VDRPTHLTTFSALAIAGGLAEVYIAGAPLLAGRVSGLLGTLIAIAWIVGAIALIVGGFALLGLVSWSWPVAVFASGFSAIMSVIAMLSDSGWGPYVGLVASGAVLFYLTSPSVRKAFSR
jgi:Na+-translocating ferredoxin:NAD+ oxidoreductase RnfD subunit